MSLPRINVTYYPTESSLPYHDLDWRAVLDGKEDPDDIHGWGSTKREAVGALIDSLVENGYVTEEQALLLAIDEVCE